MYAPIGVMHVMNRLIPYRVTFDTFSLKFQVISNPSVGQFQAQTGPLGLWRINLMCWRLWFIGGILIVYLHFVEWNLCVPDMWFNSQQSVRMKEQVKSHCKQLQMLCFIEMELIRTPLQNLTSQNYYGVRSTSRKHSKPLRSLQPLFLCLVEMHVAIFWVSFSPWACQHSVNFLWILWFL